MNMAIVKFIFLFVFSYLKALSVVDCFCGESHSSGLQVCDSNFETRIAGGEEADSMNSLGLHFWRSELEEPHFDVEEPL
jgi:hypothetical protein